jgi:hypothetical protein
MYGKYVELVYAIENIVTIDMKKISRKEVDIVV